MPKNKTWRETAKPIIAEVIATHGVEDMKALKKALREAYPFFERANHPYKVWCDEVKKQIHAKTEKELPLYEDLI